MKRVLSPVAIACTFIALSLAATSPCKAATTSVSVSAAGPSPWVLNVTYLITLESNTSFLNYVHVYAQSTNQTYHFYATSNMNYQGTFTDMPFTLVQSPTDPGLYYCGGTCEGHNPQGHWYEGSTQKQVTIPN